MTDPTRREFRISPTQYELFRFIVDRPVTLGIRLIATDPVNLLLLDNEQRDQYESGVGKTHPYTAAWGRRIDLNAAVDVDPGTWYLVVEGSTEPSRGRIEVFQQTSANGGRQASL